MSTPITAVPEDEFIDHTFQQANNAARSVANNVSANSNSNIPLFTFIGVLLSSIAVYYYSSVMGVWIRDHLFTYSITVTTSVLILSYTYNTVYNIYYTRNTQSSASKRKHVTPGSDGSSLHHQSIAYSILVVNAVYIAVFTTITAYFASYEYAQLSYIASVLISCAMSFIAAPAAV